MYKQNLELGQKLVIDAIKEGKEAIILAKYDDTTLYPIGEHISIVTNIERNYTPNGMARLTLLFKNRTVDTVAFIDTSIKVGTLVSTIGFLFDEYGASNYYCKGGINPVINTIMDIEKVYPKKVYRMGMVLELTELTTPTKKYSTLDESIQKLEGVKGDFYYIIQDVEKPKQDTFAQDILNKVRDDDGKTPLYTSIFSTIEDEEEDYPDEDTPIDVGENDNQ